MWLIESADEAIRYAQQYGRSGPRYTSYPTSPHMSDAFGHAELVDALDVSNVTRRPLSLYVHLPFCPSLCLFCACNVIVTRRRERITEYLGYLEREIREMASRIAPGRQVTQIHWGGGTPTYLKPIEIIRLGSLIAECFDIAHDAEISIEVHPGRVGPGVMEALREVGFNRISVGVQDVDQTVQSAVHRTQTAEDTRRVVDEARELGMRGVNVDLMYGLPHQTRVTFSDTLDSILALRPNRIALFNYAHVPWMKPHQNALDESAMPSADTRLRMFQAAITGLISNEYHYLGLDHFALPEDDLAIAASEGTMWRNFQGYTTHAGVDVLGLGVSSIGLFDGAYYRNGHSLDDYYGALDAGRLPVTAGLVLTREDRLRRRIIMDLMCRLRVDIEPIEEDYNIDFWDHFADARPALQTMVDDHLVHVDGRSIAILPRGRLLMRNVAMLFDEYLKPDGNARSARHSKTI